MLSNFYSHHFTHLRKIAEHFSHYGASLKAFQMNKTVFSPKWLKAKHFSQTQDLPNICRFFPQLLISLFDTVAIDLSSVHNLYKQPLLCLSLLSLFHPCSHPDNSVQDGEWDQLLDRETHSPAVEQRVN